LTGARCIGQVFKVTSYGGSGSLVSVQAIDGNAGITAVEIIAFGTGYVADFNLLISPTNFIDPTTLGARITIGGLTYKTDDAVTTQNEGGSIVSHNYTNLNALYMTDPSYVGETVGIIQSQPGVNYIAGDYASIKFTTGHVCIYPGYYKSSNNIIGDLVYIEDSYYYQAFSYVTVLEKKLEEYSDLLKRTLHPAGTKHFATYLIFDDLQLSLTLDTSLNLISKADAIRDLVQFVEQLIFSMQIELGDSATVTELFDRVFTATRSFDHAVTVTEDKYFDIMPVYADSVTATESFDRVFDSERTFTDLAISTDSFDRVWTAEFELADAPTVTELFDRAWTAFYSLADTTTNTDVFDRELTAERSFTELVVNTDVFDRVLTAERSFVDTITSSDALSVDGNAVLADAPIVTELFDRAWTALYPLADSVSVTDLFAMEPGFNLTDTFTLTDVFDRVWTAESSLADLTTVTELFNRTWSAESSFADATTNTDVFDRVWTAATTLNDTTTLVESISLFPSYNLTDAVAIDSTNIVFTPDKYNTDVTMITSAGALYMEPYYVEVTPDSYWQAGYLENEREFTN